MILQPMILSEPSSATEEGNEVNEEVGRPSFPSLASVTSRKVELFCRLRVLSAVSVCHAG